MLNFFKMMEDEMPNIKAECPCGAKLELEADFSHTIEAVYKEWSREHSGHKKIEKEQPKNEKHA